MLIRSGTSTSCKQTWRTHEKNKFFSEQNHIVLAGDFNDKRTFNTNTSLNNQLKWEL